MVVHAVVRHLDCYHSQNPEVSDPHRSVAVRHAAVGGKVVPAKEDKSFVEADAEKIAKYVCINHYVQG